MKVLDTCFLIDLQREFHRRKVGDARRFLEFQGATRFAISVISLTEFLEGFPNGSMAQEERLVRPFRWLDVDAVISREASRIRRDLRLAGRLIGDFHILIAATA